MTGTPLPRSRHRDGGKPGRTDKGTIMCYCEMCLKYISYVTVLKFRNKREVVVELFLYILYHMLWRYGP